jgi:hypothetical protein
MHSIVDLGLDYANYLALCHIHHKIKPFWVLEAFFGVKMTTFKKWARNIAVGDESFVNNVKERLGFRSKGRKIIKKEDKYLLRDGQAGYGYGNTGHLSSKNSFYWDIGRKLAGPHVP